MAGPGDACAPRAERRREGEAKAGALENGGSAGERYRVGELLGRSAVSVELLARRLSYACSALVVGVFIVGETSLATQEAPRRIPYSGDNDSSATICQ